MGPARNQPSALRTLALFAFFWLTVGFHAGTATLLGPARWIADFGRVRGWSEAFEAGVMRGVIFDLVVLSALAAWWLCRSAQRADRRHVRLGLPALALLGAGGALGLWLSPELAGGGVRGETRAGSAFTFGSYPSAARLVELRSAGYTAVVSLLHPAVAPFETKLIADGRAAAERAGLEYIHVPMLPWVSDNREALDRVARLAREPSGRFYVHCYLGKDRVRLVKRAIENAEPRAIVKTSPELSAHVAGRRLRGLERLERGAVVEIVPDVYLIPYPTQAELTSYILPGTHGSVVSLLDPDNPDDRPWIDRERELLSSHAIELASLPLRAMPHEPERALEAARAVARMPRPVVVHGFLAADSGRAPTAEAFLQAFRSDLPPLPPSLFIEPMSAGEVEVIAPNVACGPRPRGPEFGGYLHARGLREFVYLGDGKSDEAEADRAICAEAGLPWRAAGVGEKLAAQISTRGPHYLYGPELTSAKPGLARRLGPAIPGTVRVAREPTGDAARTALPGIRTLVLLGPLSLLLAGAAAAFVGWLHAVKRVRTPYTRKLFHFVIFTTAGAVHLAGGLPWVLTFGTATAAAVLYAVWRGDGFAFYEALARPTDAPRRSLFVLVPLATTAVGGLAASLLFGAMAAIGYLVCGWADAVAEPVGSAWGRHRYGVPSLGGVTAWRSLEGSAAVWIVGVAAASVGLWLGGTGAGLGLAVGLACGTAGALVEAVSHHGLDNLTVQLAASGTAYWLLG